MTHHIRSFRSSPFAPSGWVATIVVAVTVVSVLVMQACGAAQDHDAHDARSAIVVSSQLPADIDGGAFDASLAQAAEYAWTQMIAMNWAAAIGTEQDSRRGVAADNEQSAALNRGAPRVWQTLRSKTELFPGIGAPHGASEGATTDFGYDRPPVYRYNPAVVGTYPSLEAGLIPACESEQADHDPPLIELSEAHEVGPEKMFAGIAPPGQTGNPLDGQRVLYAVKVSRSFYRYVAEHGWLGGGNIGSTVPAAATAAFVAEHHASPPAGADALVGFPNGSVQIKTAWRRLNDRERASGRFLTAIARSYEKQDPARSYAGIRGDTKHPCYVDATWGLVAMHFKTRTPTAPYYIWSTFEHSDNILSIEGEPVEDSVGRVLRVADVPYTEPALSARNAVAASPPNPDSIQRMSPSLAHARPGKRIFYENRSGTPTTQGVIAVNRRAYPIAGPVVAANEAAHAVIRRFLEGPGDRREVIAPVLLNYKLVGVQWRPVDKPVPGQDLRGGVAEGDEVLHYPGIYYLANIMLETSYRLQHYSGVVQGPLSPPNEQMDVQDLITDFDAQGAPVKNVVYGGSGAAPGRHEYNMGGCMGCHGQMQKTGYDFSFIFRRGRIDAPETNASIRIPLVDMVHPGQNK